MHITAYNTLQSALSIQNLKLLVIIKTITQKSILPVGITMFVSIHGPYLEYYIVSA
jgi:hypothetical protein